MVMLIKMIMLYKNDDAINPNVALQNDDTFMNDDAHKNDDDLENDYAQKMMILLNVKHI